MEKKCYVASQQTKWALAAALKKLIGSEAFGENHDLRAHRPMSYQAAKFLLPF